ncbi:hypothetical protein BRD17_01035 [Halobacteriales archaeon SW_7_68_16]|nr:MAG: hypothetical protein BRD17_01035 [Halobacteriales archaeon SW_7_68_16]
MRRRDYLAVGGTVLATGLAGCRSMFETRSARSPPLVEDRPDAVYYPTHAEGMEMVGTTDAGDYGVALTYSFPHRFWLFTGADRRKVEVRGEDAVHMMSVVWDRETGTVVPNSSVETTVRRDGATVAEKSLWSMLSQNMGVHAGDNMALEGNGTYDIPFERLPDQQGQPGAVEPMDMEMVPVASTPAPADLPGATAGTVTSGDATVAVTRLDAPPAGVEGDGPYLAVSARTPYNGYPLPFMTVSAALARDGSEAFSGPLDPAFDPDLGYHYGAVADAQSGDDLTLSVELPPQIARHEGYETAFRSFEDATLSL